MVVVPVGWSLAGRLETGDRFFAQGFEVRHHGGVLEVAVNLQAGQQAGVGVLPGIVVRGVMETPGRVILAVKARHLEQVVDVEAHDDGYFFPGLKFGQVGAGAGCEALAEILAVGGFEVADDAVQPFHLDAGSLELVIGIEALQTAEITLNAVHGDGGEFTVTVTQTLCFEA
ncbi:hypothetical protein D3C77_465030 [compost metagenome]